MLEEVKDIFCPDQARLAERFEMGHLVEGRPLDEELRKILEFRMNMTLIIAKHLPTETFNAWSAIIDDEVLKNEVEKWVDGIKN